MEKKRFLTQIFENYLKNMLKKIEKQLNL